MAEKEEQTEEQTIAADIVVTKYKVAGEIVNGTLKKIVEKCQPGAKVLDLCDFGDQNVITETSKVYKKEKELKKGIAFPTCVSVNNCVCHFSPLKSEADVIIKDGDLVKVDLGAHIDGFSAVVAHCFVVGASKDKKITGRKADVIIAAHTAAEAALRIVKPGNENNAVTDAVQKVAESFECKPIEGMLSHQLKQHVIDGEKAIIQNPTEAQKKEHEQCEFDVHEVYGVDVLISTGEGKGRELDTRTTVYKKKDGTYNLKMKTSRQFYSETDKKFGTMPFTLRNFDDEKKAKLGVVECVKHELVEPFGVLWERDNEFVAQFKFTVLLMPNGPMKITGLPFPAECYKTEHKITDESIKSLLSISISKKTAKKKKKKAGQAMVKDNEITPEDTNTEATAAES